MPCATLLSPQGAVGAGVSLQAPSSPGLSRPSTPFARNQGVDTRDRPGYDGVFIEREKAGELAFTGACPAGQGHPSRECEARLASPQPRPASPVCWGRGRPAVLMTPRHVKRSGKLEIFKARLSDD